MSIAELISGVNISLDNGQLDVCPVFDTDEDFDVSVNELIMAVNSALSGCLAVSAPSFHPAREVHNGRYDSSVAAADLNGDGVSDLIITDWGNGGEPGYLSVLLGVGDGTFQPEQRYVVGVLPGGNKWGARPVTEADLNADDVPDLVVYNAGGLFEPSVSVLLGAGDGSFADPESYSGIIGVLAVTDLNADDVPDLVGQSSVLFGVGDGSFADAEPHEFGGSVVVADLNSDDVPDLVVPDSDAGLFVLLGACDGSFTAGQPRGGISGAVAMADLNSDDVPDLVIANIDTGLVVLLGVGDGTFEGERRYSATQQPLSVEVADLNGDGAPDLVVDFDVARRQVSVLLGVGDGTFAYEQRYPRAPVNWSGDYPSGVAVADLNADGVPDLVTASTYGGVSVLLGLP